MVKPSKMSSPLVKPAQVGTDFLVINSDDENFMTVYDFDDSRFEIFDAEGNQVFMGFLSPQQVANIYRKSRKHGVDVLDLARAEQTKGYKHEPPDVQ